jgi:hypothetical protein
VKHVILAVECHFFIQTAKIGQFFYGFLSPKTPFFSPFVLSRADFIAFFPSNHFGRPENVYSGMGCATVGD